MWVLRVKNVGDRPRRLRSFSYAEFGYYDAAHRPAEPRLGHAHRPQPLQAEGTIYVSTQFRPTSDLLLQQRQLPPASTPTAKSLSAVAATWPTPRWWRRVSRARAKSPRGNSIGSLCHDLDSIAGRGARKSSTSWV